MYAEEHNFGPGRRTRSTQTHTDTKINVKRQNLDKKISLDS